MVVLIVSASVLAVAVLKHKLRTSMQCFRKTLNLRLGVFFISLILPAFTWSQAKPSNCPSPISQMQQAELGHVVDGDSLVLNDGRKLRLIGINTPELTAGLGAQKKLARDAKRAVMSFFAGQKAVYLLNDLDNMDRYKRQLTHIYRQDGLSLTAFLLEQGLGWQVVVPPNALHASCYKAIEQQAKINERGVWQESSFFIDAEHMSSRHTGFHLVSGVVSKVSRSKSGWWLEIGKLAVSIKDTDARNFEHMYFPDLLNKKILLKGWVIDRSRQENTRKNGYLPFMMHWRHPFMAELR